VSDGPNLDAYLKRINYAGSIAPTIETLQMLHRLHPAAIPFENLDPLMEQPVRLTLSDLEQKLVVERRGGYCFEHNLLLKAVLEDMDFKVTALGARVALGLEPPPEFSATPNHIALLVDVGGVVYLADVGLGRQVMTAPLRLRSNLEQETPNERYRLVGGEPDWQLETAAAEGWRPLYKFDLAARGLDDFIAMNDVAMARFRDNLFVSRVDGSRRYGLRNSRLRTYDGPETTTRMLTSVAEIRDVLTTIFGIQLPVTDRLDPALEKALRPGAND
jgi:N-hydroxyarylamine O-acetyltransferase